MTLPLCPSLQVVRLLPSHLSLVPPCRTQRKPSRFFFLLEICSIKCIDCCDCRGKRFTTSFHPAALIFYFCDFLNVNLRLVNGNLIWGRFSLCHLQFALFTSRVHHCLGRGGQLLSIQMIPPCPLHEQLSSYFGCLADASAVHSARRFPRIGLKSKFIDGI